MPRNLSEKTLELHVHAELYHESRTQGLTPVMIGFTQAEEIALGADSQVRWGVRPSDRAVILQFKKAKAWQRHFTFYINNNSQRNQHAALLNFGARERIPAFYVLPLVGTEQDLIRCSPGLLERTALADSAEIGPLDPSDREHRLVIQHEQAWQVIVYSEPRQVKLMRFDHLVSGIRTRDFGITLERLHEWLEPYSLFRLELRRGWWESQLPELQSRWIHSQGEQQAIDMLPRSYRHLFRAAWGKETDDRLRQAFEAGRDTADYKEAVLSIKTVPIEYVLLQSIRLILFKFS